MCVHNVCCVRVCVVSAMFLLEKLMCEHTPNYMYMFPEDSKKIFSSGIDFLEPGG